MSLGIFFQDFGSQYCCLCGDSKKLTHEHKIKASSLRNEFGKAELCVGTIGDNNARLKFAQSVKSKHLKFNVRICEACNTSRTQQADREFDNFNQIARDYISKDQDPAKVFKLPQYQKHTEAYLNVFRYFAKILCCQIAEVEAPRPKRLSNFAIGNTATNYVWLAVQRDWTYGQIKEHLGEHQYAAHGGLIVYGSKTSGNANAFHSSLTVGPIQYVFYMRLAWVEKLELKILYPNFSKWCREQVENARQSPLSTEEKLTLGL